MSMDWRAGDVLAPGSDAGPPPLPVAAILTICDRLLDAVGRRHHLFSWLRRPDAPTEEWLPVDAYYPSRRVVVMCAENDREYLPLYEELIPAHGMRLLQLAPSQLGDDPEAATATVERKIADLALPPRPSGMPADEANGPSPASAVAQAVAALVPPTPPPVPKRPPRGPDDAAAAERAARFLSAHKAELQAARTAAAARSLTATVLSKRARPSARGGGPVVRGERSVVRGERSVVRGERSVVRGDRSMVRGERSVVQRRLPLHALLIGLALVVVLGLEVYFVIGRAALDHGRLLLALGLAFDAGARGLSTVAAERTGRRVWAWACVLFGSPAAAWFALFQESGPVLTAPAPLAGLMSILALVLMGLGLIVA
jgi:hypothetical protein